MDRSLFRYDVFISYSHDDGTWVHDWLLPQLEAAALRVCIDTRDFAIGQPSIVNMETAVIESRHTLLVLTPAWVNSAWTNFEVLLTQTTDPVGRQQRVLPLLLAPCEPPRRIAYLTYADFTDPQQRPAQFRRLLDVVQGRVRHVDLGPRLQHLLPDHLLTPAERNRRAMLRLVHKEWITDVLEQSLYHEVLIALGLTSHPAAVTRPLNLAFQRPHQNDQPLAVGTTIIDVYDSLQGTLLILGAPGAGKTTLLLQLTRELLQRAERDPQHLIPVVFPLSTWALTRLPLQTWLVDTLVQLYNIPRSLAQDWVATDQILPLLDGLDEVAIDDRSACVMAINTYRQEHGLLPLVVCSRLHDYGDLTTQLNLRGAVVAQPVSVPQVHDYFDDIELPAIPATSALWDVLDTPLMLNITALTYAGQSAAALTTLTDSASIHDQLFAAYIDRMFTRNTAWSSFTTDETRHYLTFLAAQMQQHDQTIFYLDNLQPSWLPSTQQRHWRRLSARTGAVIGLILGLIGGLIGGVITGVVSGLLSALILALVGAQPDSIKPTEVVRWSWSKARRPFIRTLGVSLGIYSIIGILLGLLSSLVLGQQGQLMIWLLAGLLLGVLIGLVVGVGLGSNDLVVMGLSEETIKQKTSPKQSIQRSGMNGLWVGLIGGLIVGLGNGLVVGLFSGMLSRDLSVGLGSGLVTCLTAMLVLGLRYGGRAYLQHHLLLHLLHRNGSLPHRLVPFLDYATQRIFLRRVGGGYIFIHRLLLEYVAAQYIPSDTPASTSASHTRHLP